MTVSTTISSQTFPGNGVAQSFPCDFRIFNDTDVQVQLVKTADGTTSTLVLNTDYTISGAGDAAGFTLATTNPVAIGYTLTVERVMPYEQPTDFTNQGSFFPSMHEDMADRLEMQIQQVAGKVGRALVSNLATGDYSALGHRITDLADATNPGDATSLQQMEQAIAAAQITPSVPAADVALLSNLASTVAGKGAALIGYLTGTVKSFLDTLTASTGAALVGFKQSGATTVIRSVLSKLRDTRTVEDWGAVGDGVTNDSAAFLAMAADTGGVVRMRDATYFVGNLTFPASASISLFGRGMPRSDAGFTKLTGGTIVIGGINIQANQVHVEDFGLDAGTGRGIVTGTYDGLVINAIVGQQGTMCQIHRVAAMGADGTTTSGTSHGILVQGYTRGMASKIYCAMHQFGLVVKCHNFVISDVSGDLIRTALVYPKSDTPDVGGNVLDASAANIEITNVQYRPGSSNTEGSAVYLHGSTLSFNSARVNNISALYGHSAVRIQGGGSSSLTCGSIVINNIFAERTQYAIYSGGYTYDWVASNIRCTNPATGCVVTMDTSTTNWCVYNANLLITDSAITGAYAFLFYGTGQWNNLAVRNPYATQLVKVQATGLKNVRTGLYSGNVALDYEGALSGLNGATASTPTPTLKFLPNSQIQLSGRFSLTGSTNKAFCNIPNLSISNDMIFGGGYIDSANAYQVCAIRLSGGFQLSIEPSLPAGAKFVDLSNIIIPVV